MAIIVHFYLVLTTVYITKTLARNGDQDKHFNCYHLDLFTARP